MQGRVRSDLVALCTLIALLLTDILEPAEALAGFSSSVVIMMVGLFIVGAGIFRTGLAKMISSRILKLGGRNENVLFVLVMLVTAVVGAVVSNTGTVAVMMPIVVSMAAGSGISTRRYLMPMAFASSMGMFTLISTPPILVIQDALISAGQKPLGFFSFAPVGATAITVGILVLYFLCRKLKPKVNDPETTEKRGKSLSTFIEEYNLISQFFKMTVPANSEMIDKSLSDMRIASTYNVSIAKIIRKSLPGNFIRPAEEEIPTPASVIRAGDTLYAYSSKENIHFFAEEMGVKVESMSERDAQRDLNEYGMAEVFIMPDSNLINRTVHESRFREKYSVNVLGLKRKGKYGISDIRNAKMKSGDSLLIQGTWDQITSLSNRQENDLVVIGQPAREAAKVTLDRRAPLAAAIMIGMIAMMVLNIVPAVVAVLAAAILMVVSGCLRNMEEAYAAINWNSIVLIGAMIPMATAFEKTGVTQFISTGLLEGLGITHPWMLLAVIYLATSVTTMFLSNTATAILFTPIAMHAAMDIGVNPWPFLFAVAVAASMCFASPFSTPPNALVMSAGHYSFKDYVRIGLPLQLIMAAVMILLLPLFFKF